MFPKTSSAARCIFQGKDDREEGNLQKTAAVRVEQLNFAVSFDVQTGMSIETIPCPSVVIMSLKKMLTHPDTIFMGS